MDFFQLGTNDLSQYALAVDRTNPKVAGMMDGLHPAVLQLIKLVTDAGSQRDLWVGGCGELGSDLAAVPIPSG